MCTFFHHGRRRRRLNSQAGQAVLEYILLLLVAILIIGGSLYQYNSAFRVFMDRTFGQGGYLACLIENGLLPGADNDACPPYQFSLADGRPGPLSGAGQGTGTGTTPPGQAGANRNQGVDGNQQIGRNSPGNTRASEGGRSNIPLSLRDNPPGGRTGSGEDGAGGGKGKSDYTGSGEFSSVPVGQDATRGRGQGRDRTVPIGSDADEVTAAARATGKVPLNERDLKTGRELAFEKAERKRKAEEEMSALSFGNILKWLIIIALIFSIIFFIGSQLVAVSRGSRRQR